MRSGIAVAGYVGVDVLKEITGFPGRMIWSTSRASAFPWAVWSPTVPAIWRSWTGTSGVCLRPHRQRRLWRRDPQGLGKYKNIDTSMLRREGQTAFSDVLSNIQTRARAFLTFAGACAQFCEEDVPVQELPCKIFHAGYVLLLDALDQPDAECGTKMARLLKRVQEMGILTSVDMVTTAERERMRLVCPAIRYTDILCLNEHESEIAAGIPLRDESDALIYENIPKVLGRFREMGARKWAVIHAPEGGFGLDEKGEYRVVPGAVVPKEYIGGTVGAGDAFTSGILLGAHRDSTLEEAMTYATAAAVASLRNGDASEGVLPLEEALALLKTFPRAQLH